MVVVQGACLLAQLLKVAIKSPGRWVNRKGVGEKAEKSQVLHTQLSDNLDFSWRDFGHLSKHTFSIKAILIVTFVLLVPTLMWCRLASYFRLWLTFLPLIPALSPSIFVLFRWRECLLLKLWMDAKISPTMSTRVSLCHCQHYLWPCCCPLISHWMLLEHLLPVAFRANFFFCECLSFLTVDGIGGSPKIPWSLLGFLGTFGVKWASVPRSRQFGEAQCHNYKYEVEDHHHDTHPLGHLPLEGKDRDKDQHKHYEK